MKTKIKTPEGITRAGHVDDEKFEAVRLLHGGEDFHVQFRVNPYRKLRKAIWDVVSTSEIQTDKPQARQVYTALAQLALPLNPVKFLEYSVTSGIVAPDVAQRGGLFHSEVYPTTATSNHPLLTTEYLVDDKPQDRNFETRVLSKDDLLHGYDGLTTTDLDGKSREEIERLGLTFWSPDASEVIQSHNAVHRSVVNETGEAQERVFARATQL